MRCVHGAGYDEVVDEARLTGRRYRRCNSIIIINLLIFINYSYLYRRCNWVRFLRKSDGDGDSHYNLRCFREAPNAGGGSIVFEAVEDIEAGAELVARQGKCGALWCLILSDKISHTVGFVKKISLKF